MLAHAFRNILNSFKHVCTCFVYFLARLPSPYYFSSLRVATSLPQSIHIFPTVPVRSRSHVCARQSWNTNHTKQQINQSFTLELRNKYVASHLACRKVSAAVVWMLRLLLLPLLLSRTTQRSAEPTMAGARNRVLVPLYMYAKLSISVSVLDLCAVGHTFTPCASNFTPAICILYPHQVVRKSETIYFDTFS